MTRTESANWVPEACTLPSADQPLRRSEFDELFTTALLRQERITAQRLRWHLDPRAEPTARDLTAREGECCSFFTFGITAGRIQVAVDIAVPPEHVDVLDALQARATTLLAAG